MSQPAPMVSPPEPSTRVKAPIQVPSPTVGSPTTHACSFHGLGGSPASIRASLGPDQVDHALLDVDGGLEAQHLLGPGHVCRPAADQDVALVEDRLHVGA